MAEIINVELEQESILETVSELTTTIGISDEIKQALLQCFEHVAWVDDEGQTYYDALYDALYPPVDLSSISCVYTQSGTVYDTDTLDSLKTDLVVTAHYSDQSTETITTYTLSGTLTEGTSTITVSYMGKTTTFTVNVSSIPYPLLNGEFVDSTNTFRITVTNGHHIKAEVLTRSTSTNAIGINLYNGDIGIGSSSSTPTLNQPEKFAIPSGTICTLSTTGFSNDGIQYVMALRYTSGTISMLNTDWQTVSMNLTETTSANAPIGCVFLYLKRETAPVGSILEFDVSITVGGVRYV